ncbi:MAG TPA: hypothetical protein VN200_00070 [Rhodoglobus sp.]|nr:hypothetical protein [Rhodoglobus sp.]
MTVAEPSPYADTAPPPASRGRGLAAAITVFLGGYLVIQSLGGQLAAALGGFLGGSAALTALLVSQFVFALLVVVAGLLLAPGRAAAKLIAAAAALVLLVVVLLLISARLTGALRLGPEASYTVANPWFMTVLIVGAAWLLASRARLGWLTLIAAVLLSFPPTLMAIAGVESAVTTIVMLTLSAVVGALIVAVGRPWRS